MSITVIATNEEKKRLRKIKGLNHKEVEAARHALVKGCQGGGLSGAYLQFGQDVQTYNLWEALLYAESYQRDGNYVPGTVERALKAALGAKEVDDE